MRKKKIVEQTDTIVEQTDTIVEQTDTIVEKPLVLSEQKARLAELLPRIHADTQALKDKAAALGVEGLAAATARFAESAKSAEIAQNHVFAVGRVLLAIDEAVTAVEKVEQALSAA